jgi:hypothetical protein
VDQKRARSLHCSTIIFHCGSAGTTYHCDGQADRGGDIATFAGNLDEFPVETSVRPFADRNCLVETQKSQLSSHRIYTEHAHIFDKAGASWAWLLEAEPFIAAIPSIVPYYAPER